MLRAIRSAIGVGCEDKEDGDASDTSDHERTKSRASRFVVNRGGRADGCRWRVRAGAAFVRATARAEQGRCDVRGRRPGIGEVLGTVPTGQGPHELVASTDGKTAFASNYGTGPAPGHTISMIDIAAMKELRRIDVAPLCRPHGLAFANGKRLLHRRGEQDNRPLRSGDRQGRLAVRDRSERNAHGAADEGRADALHVEYRLGQHFVRSSRDLAAPGPRR